MASRPARALKSYPLKYNQFSAQALTASRPAASRRHLCSTRPGRAPTASSQREHSNFVFAHPICSRIHWQAAPHSSGQHWQARASIQVLSQHIQSEAAVQVLDRCVVFRSSAGPPDHPIYSRLAFKPRTHRDGQQARASIQVFSMHWQAHLSRFSTAGAATGRAKVERAAALWAFRLRAGRDSDCRVEPRQTDSSHDSENLKQTAIKLRASRDREFLSNEQQ